MNIIVYETILNKIVKGELIHADETRINLIGKDGYVWVVTNMEEVAYFYTDTREGDTIQALIQGFIEALNLTFKIGSLSETEQQRAAEIRDKIKALQGDELPLGTQSRKPKTKTRGRKKRKGK